MSLQKARFYSFIRKVFEEDMDLIDEEVSEQFGISKEELHPKKYAKRELERREKERQEKERQEQEELNQKQQKQQKQQEEREENKRGVGNEEDVKSSHQRGNHQETNGNGNQEKEVVNDKVLNISEYQREETKGYEVQEDDDKRVKRLITVLKEELGNNYRSIKLGVNFDESNPYGISFQMLSKETELKLEFSIYYIYDLINKRYIYQQGKGSRVESEEYLRKLFKGNKEMLHVLDSYVRAVKLNYSIDKE